MPYFDNAATSPLTPAVKEAMLAAMDIYGNPSSLHQEGRKASKLLRDSRQTVADTLDVPAQRIIFTSGGTESNAMAIQGYALANQSKGKHLITTAIEHHSVLHTMAYLTDRFGFEVTYLRPKVGQPIMAADVQAALRPDTILVSAMFANNETGDLLPIAEIGQILANHQAVFHVDAVQAVGKVPIYPEQLGIDLLSASAHKFHGPKGVGFLYSGQVHLDPLLHGGEQEDKRRASTENLIGIAGMAQALKDSLTNQTAHYGHIQDLRQTLLDRLDIPATKNGFDPSLPHVLNLSLPGANNNTLLTRLDLAGFAVSTGSACTAGTVEPSHVLSAYYGADAPQLTNSIRISFSDQNTLDEVKSLAKALNIILGDSHGI